MTLDTSYPQPEGLRVDHAQRFSDSSADRALAGRYSRLSVLLVASLALHLSILTALDLSVTAPPASAGPHVISVELVSDPQAAAASKSAAASQKKAVAKPAEAAKLDTKPAVEQPSAPETKKVQPPESEAAKPASSQAEAAKQQTAEAKSEEPPPKMSTPKPVAISAKPAAAPAPPAPESVSKPQPTVMKPRSVVPKPAAPQPPPQSPPWEQAPSQASQPQQLSDLGKGSGLPLNEQAQEAVPVQMPSADGDVAISYETVVSGKLALARRHPPEVRARAAHGAAMIAFLIDDKGHVVKLKLLKSSGDAALDVESLALVMRAEPFPPPPPGAEREFAIKVDFDPKK